MVLTARADTVITEPTDWSVADAVMFAVVRRSVTFAVANGGWIAGVGRSMVRTVWKPVRFGMSLFMCITSWCLA